jgi:hypothetical protein
MSRQCRWMLVALVVSWVSPSVSNRLFAAELLAEDLPLAQVIDGSLQQQFDQRQVHPAPLANDSTLVRRMTLDLAGRIPTFAEARSYTDSTDADKRAKLVERLMSSPDFPFHMRNCLDTLLMDGQRNTPGEWREYLLKSIRQNRPWDQLFRDMIVGNEDDADVKPALTFLKTRARDLDQLTNDASSLFFGVNVSCAKCHDHPLVDDWKQDHYYGMASFFHRTYLTKKNGIAEKFSGDVKFKTTRGEDKVARIMFLSGGTVDPPQIEKSAEQLKQENDEVNRQTQDDNAGPPQKPDFSPRAKLVELALQAEHNHFFAKNAVNRIWALLIGRGLVHPLDQMHSSNPASHPELLDWLSRDLVAHHYDLQRLIRGIVSSNAYARSSVWDSASEPPARELFALALVRPLSSRQYSLSLRIASLNPEALQATNSPEWAKRREEFERNADDLANQFEVPGENFQVGVDEALLFTNNSKLWDDYVRQDGEGLVGCLKLKTERTTQIDVAYWTIFARPPLPEERSFCDEFLTHRTSDSTTALRQFVWSLLASPELRFNH